MDSESQRDILNDQPLESLLGLDLGIGDALQLQDSLESSLRYYVKLIGFLNKAGVIISHPVRDAALLPVEDGKSFLVRGFSGRKTYVFESAVLSSSMVPYPHVHLSFPNRIDCKAMRAALRVKPKSLGGWIEPMTLDSGAIRMPMTIVDMSTSGVRVHAERAFGKIGDQIKVVFSLPVDDEERSFSIPAVIRKSYTETPVDGPANTDVMMHGLEFLQPEGSVRMALQGYIYKTMAGG